MTKLKLHHGYIGAILVVWSLLTICFKLGVIGEFRLELASAGLIIGATLLIHDAYWHLTHRKH